MRNTLFFPAVIFLALLFIHPATRGEILLETMQQELERSVAALKDMGDDSLYFLQYEVYDIQEVGIGATLSALSLDKRYRRRFLKVDVRVGSPNLDNSHEIRGAGFDFSAYMPREAEIPIENDPAAIRAVIWQETDKAFRDAKERYIKVKANAVVKVAEADQSADFSPADTITHIGEAATLEMNEEECKRRLKDLSAVFAQYPWIYSSSVTLRAKAVTRYLVNSEGTVIKDGLTYYRISAVGSTVADDGMDLYLFVPFDSHSYAGLANQETMAQGIRRLVADLDKLRGAPLVEPYTGPAILMHRASGVFFHEIFGHRIEGHRQKSEKECQTFTKRVGKPVLPAFISVYDDPSKKRYNGQDLNGFFRFDDEGVPAQPVTVVDKGILKNFLMSRSPITGFAKSNGHGRREHGRNVVARQGNLIVEAHDTVPFSELRNMLIAECRRQGKPYGLIFDDLSGGFTSTQRSYAQVFKVLPLLVRKVFADGRPDEIVRGVDIVGTPLLAFSKIMAAADDVQVFNGTCGAESGSVPVSAVSPSILVQEIEVEKKYKGQDKPPILAPPQKKHGGDDQ